MFLKIIFGYKMTDFYKNGRFSHSENKTWKFFDWVKEVGFSPGQKIIISKFASEDEDENEYKSFWIGHGTRNLSPSYSEDGFFKEDRYSWEDYANEFLDWVILEVWDYEE